MCSPECSKKGENQGLKRGNSKLRAQEREAETTKIPSKEEYKEEKIGADSSDQKVSKPTN